MPRENTLDTHTHTWTLLRGRMNLCMYVCSGRTYNKSTIYIQRHLKAFKWRPKGELTRLYLCENPKVTVSHRESIQMWKLFVLFVIVFFLFVYVCVFMWEYVCCFRHYICSMWRLLLLRLDDILWCYVSFQLEKMKHHQERLIENSVRGRYTYTYPVYSYILYIYNLDTFYTYKFTHKAHVLCTLNAAEASDWRQISLYTSFNLCLRYKHTYIHTYLLIYIYIRVCVL